jgi:hypothetical protein
MEPEGSFQFLQGPATESFSGPDSSNPFHPVLLSQKVTMECLTFLLRIHESMELRSLRPDTDHINRNSRGFLCPQANAGIVLFVCMSDYRRGLDWKSDLWDFLIQRVTTLYVSLLHTYTHVHSHVFTSRCLVAASNGGRSPSSGFLNCTQLPDSNSNNSQGLNRSSPLAQPTTSL